MRRAALVVVVVIDASITITITTTIPSVPEWLLDAIFLILTKRSLMTTLDADGGNRWWEQGQGEPTWNALN